MQMNKNLGLFAFLQNISFHGVCLDVLFRQTKKFKSFMSQITKLLNDGIKNGVVKPIERTTFDTNQVEQAFRYMTTGKHIGKVLIKIRDEESEKIVVSPKPLLVNAITKTWLHSSKVIEFIFN
jgi:fatty acid synthase, animal type